MTLHQQLKKETSETTVPVEQDSETLDFFYIKLITHYKTKQKANRITKLSVRVGVVPTDTTTYDLTSGLETQLVPLAHRKKLLKA